MSPRPPQNATTKGRGGLRGLGLRGNLRADVESLNSRRGLGFRAPLVDGRDGDAKVGILFSNDVEDVVARLVQILARFARVRANAVHEL